MPAVLTRSGEEPFACRHGAQVMNGMNGGVAMRDQPTGTSSLSPEPAVNRSRRALVRDSKDSDDLVFLSLPSAAKIKTNVPYETFHAGHGARCNQRR
jgi:hypothetical protein